MAAIGGDTIVPTNWPGLIAVALVVIVVAAVTYFGIDMTFERGDGQIQEDKSLSVQDVFSASARREVAAAGTARALSRADLTVDQASSSPAAPDTQNSDDGWDAPADAWEQSTAEWDDSSSEVAAAPQTTPQPTPKSTPKSTPKPTAAPVRAPKPTAAPAKITAAAPAAPVQRKRPSADQLTAWWKDTENASGFSVRFAGTLDRGDRVSDGLAVMFSEPVTPSQAQPHLQLRDSAGSSLQVNWKVGANPALLFVEGLAEGRYTLSIDGALPGQSGRTLGASVSGQLFVY